MISIRGISCRPASPVYRVPELRLSPFRKMAGYKLLLEDGLLEIAPSTFRQQQRDGSKESDAESDDSDWARDFREVQG